ncbi:MAG: group III truncated hemoglobin [Cohaesibacter sp.]|nr:group III truncated hemoglobin [Cohaesibacter sp.]
MSQHHKVEKQEHKPLSVRPLTRLKRQGQPLEPSITQEMVDQLVEAFYGKVRQHERLALLFANDMSKDWAEHLDQMKAFWRSVVMQTAEYQGRPVPAHMKMTEIKPEDFASWLSLFRETAHEICTPGAASLFINRAETIARSLQMAIFLRGMIAPPDAFEHGVMKQHVIDAMKNKQN